MKDNDPTHLIQPPAAADMLRANAGRILGDMLNEGVSGMEQEGDSIGPYRLCEVIGEGGFGNVWRAEQTEVVKREVALKVIKMGMDTAQVLGRFNQERQALAALEHPNIATMLDAGVGPNGRPYFAMELVRGGSITRWCREHGVALHERLRLFIQVCQAVHHAHEKGILHRDIKPNNVLVTEVDGAPVPKVIDFGIAKAMSGSPAEQSLLTQTGQVIGTPLYMSPEQIEGGVELDARSDVYALGALLYELLTGVTPFSPDSSSKGGMEGIKRAILETDPERPSTRLRKQWKMTAQGRSKRLAADRLASLPADLDWITMRALEKRREHRYVSAAEMAADVRRHLDSQPVLARGPGTAYRMRRWVNRHRKALATTAAGIVIGILALSAPGFFELALWRNFRTAVRHAWVFDIGFKAAPSAAEATRAMPYENSLGMRFVPVPVTGGPTDGQRVLFSIWATRVRDYQVFASETQRQWIRPQFEQGPMHPAVMMSWHDAQAFCAWLTERERKAGRLGQDLAYRLPSDHEWSCAVGIGDREDPAQLPAQKRGGLPGVYPWGTQWPPPDHVGNYHSQETKKRWLTNQPVLLTRLQLHPFPDYRDGHALTSPVGSFTPNALGLYDLGGNIWEWCQDLLGHETRRATRGGSWFDYREEYMRSSMRGGIDPGMPHEHLGFRVVLAPDEKKAKSDLDDVAGVFLTEPAASPPLPAATASPEKTVEAFTNSLGMKFLPVRVTGGPTSGHEVLFSIWETRVRDYEAFIKETERAWQRPEFEQGAEHPAVMVKWDDARAFCLWLTERERKAGKLQADQAYRLPSDHEWSCAIGIGGLENPAQLPAQKSRGLPEIYPWGTSGPPPNHFGNYLSKETAALWLTKRPVLEKMELKLQVSLNYEDGHALTASVGSFAPNALGLHDLGGNVWEWCEDLFEPGTRRVVRGCSWFDYRKENMRSCARIPLQPATYHEHIGFRVVLGSAGKAAQETTSNSTEPYSFPETLKLSEAQKHTFTNSLGMKFLPVPGTSMLFCVHETRRRDYATFAETAPSLDTWWKTAQFDGLPVGHGDDHPVAGVSWAEAVQFCGWLSRKEGRVYRLPTHAEWCVAVGLKEMNNPGSTAESERIEKTSAVPWGSGRMEECGNYADASFHERFPARPAMKAVRDGHATTAPAMSFKPNLFGLYDMGGNIDEWCADWFDDSQKTRVSMGGCFATSAPALLLSSFRGWGNPSAHMPFKGFRIVLERGHEEAKP